MGTFHTTPAHEPQGARSTPRRPGFSLSGLRSTRLTARQANQADWQFEICIRKQTIEWEYSAVSDTRGSERYV